ncbi:hypothetical protein PAMC26577_16585 [Caballeronia sordidicola]|uniref:Uncharacterized protein n=1 Tax=Caballeronia sordidicola TaxID=196367 RepID=A0A242MSB7_CABSO|nr:hypothetical protein PAMC26577_16585 [Caballeronia sordidicola]
MMSNILQRSQSSRDAVRRDEPKPFDASVRAGIDVVQPASECWDLRRGTS